MPCHYGDNLSNLNEHQVDQVPTAVSLGLTLLIRL